MSFPFEFVSSAATRHDTPLRSVHRSALFGCVELRANKGIDDPICCIVDQRNFERAPVSLPEFWYGKSLGHTRYGHVLLGFDVDRPHFVEHGRRNHAKRICGIKS